MKRRATAGGKSVEHKRSMTDLDHSSTRFYPALIVLAVPTIPARPSVGPFHDPALLSWGKASRAHRTQVHCDAPARPMLGHPSLSGMVRILLIGQARHKTWQNLGRDDTEPG